LEAIRGDKTIAELAAQHEIHPNHIQTWKKALLDNAHAAFEKPSGKADQDPGKLYE
jgi:transposase-like protein